MGGVKLDRERSVPTLEEWNSNKTWVGQKWTETGVLL